MAKAKRDLRAHLRKTEFSAVGMCVRLGAAPNSAVQRPLKGEDYALSRCPQPKSLLAPERRRVCDRFPRQAYTEAESGGVTYFTCLRNWARPRLQEAPR